jgi:glycosyltransferase involved in cell wall biosynthesis
MAHRPDDLRDPRSDHITPPEKVRHSESPTAGAPLVSILTPVYNGAPYLTECVESVIGQQYDNWEYIIVNNCSTDGTLEIARNYASRFAKIRVHCNERFVPAADNHNIAFGLISPESKYCKVVSADDWIMPDCLAKMVWFAEAHPSVGIVGGYQRSGDRVKWQGLPSKVSLISGRDVCRLGLLADVHVFANPTTLLYRTDLVRTYAPFFPHDRSHCDTSTCYRALQHCDFGFLHEVLSVERLHPGQTSAGVDKLGAGNIASLETLQDYGPIYLTEDELAARKRDCYAGYYRYLGGCVLKLKGLDFWRFHSRGLKSLGTQMQRAKILIAAAREVLEESKHPKTAAKKLMEVLASKVRGG